MAAPVFGQTLNFFLIFPTGQAVHCACFHASPGENSICQGESQQVHGDRQAGESEEILTFLKHTPCRATLAPPTGLAITSSLLVALALCSPGS